MKEVSIEGKENERIWKTHTRKCFYNYEHSLINITAKVNSTTEHSRAEPPSAIKWLRTESRG
jgi:hypothetical protein